jgi:hypothetical protein
MTTKEFELLLKEAQHVPLSPFCDFCVNLRGYDFTYKGVQCDKWELFHVEPDFKKVFKNPNIGYKVKEGIIKNYRRHKQFFTDNKHLFSYEQSREIEYLMKNTTPDNIGQIIGKINIVK